MKEFEGTTMVGLRKAVSIYSMVSGSVPGGVALVAPKIHGLSMKCCSKSFRRANTASTGGISEFSSPGGSSRGLRTLGALRRLPIQAAQSRTGAPSGRPTTTLRYACVGNY